jgi:hypothetical protein
VALLALVAGAAGTFPGGRDGALQRDARPVAAAHIPPPAHCQAILEEDRISLQLMVYGEIYQHWWKRDPAEAELLKGEDLKAFAPEVEGFVARCSRVTVDGIPIRPVLEGFTYWPPREVNDNIPYVLIDLYYGTKGRPREIRFAWVEWEVFDEWLVEQIPLVVEVTFDAEAAVAALRRKEPEYVWHAPLAPAEPARRTLRPPPPPELIEIPMVSFVAFGILAIALPLLWWRRASRGTVLATGGVLLAVTAAFWGTARHPVRPPWEPAYQRPDAEQAAYIFTSLHRNIYRAFDYDSESDIYDALAESLDPGLIDRVFGEVYESLILRDEGGARCKVKSVKVVDAQVEFPKSPDVLSFSVSAKWRVQGMVDHWGHQHLRTNEYRARYELIGDGDRWRIADVEILRQRRLGPDVGVFGR